VTALRETHEEVRIPDKMELLSFYAYLYLQVTLWFIPFGICKESLFCVDPTEVSGIIELPLSVF
jgi:8-oxo-dGTP pyrophosphatase MutT (NUDIX family)